MKTTKQPDLQATIDMQWHIIHRMLAIYSLFKYRPLWGIGRKVYDILHPNIKTLEKIHYYELDKLKHRITELEIQLNIFTKPL